MTPFLIGVVSFGDKCASGTPGIYTRLASYMKWIEDVTKASFDSIDCYKRYKDFRDFDIRTQIPRIKHACYDSNIATIGWSTGSNVTTCGGAFLTEDYVLTTASCLDENGFKWVTTFI